MAYTDSLWLTRKVHIPIKIGDENVLIESSIGLSIKNDDRRKPAEVYKLANNALRSLILLEIENYLNDDSQSELLEYARKVSADDPDREIAGKSLDELKALGLITSGADIPEELEDE